MLAASSDEGGFAVPLLRTPRPPCMTASRLVRDKINQQLSLSTSVRIVGISYPTNNSPPPPLRLPTRVRNNFRIQMIVGSSATAHKPTFSAPLRSQLNAASPTTLQQQPRACGAFPTTQQRPQSTAPVILLVSSMIVVCAESALSTKTWQPYEDGGA